MEILDFALLFVIGLLSTIIGTLAGGGGLISLPAMLAFGVPVHSAIGANKVSNTVSALSAFISIYRSKGVSIQEGFKIIPVSLIGGISGGLIATALSPDVLYKIAIGLLIFAFLFSFVGSADFSGNKTFRLKSKGTPILYGIGIYDGMFGPGQGTLMLYLFSHMRISYYRAVGLVRIATFASCLGAAVSYISTGQIIWSLTLAIMAGSLSGAQIGVKLASKIQRKHVQILLRVVTILLIIQLIYDSIVS